MAKKTSLKDIAKAMEVSVTTVSFVLNGKGKEKKISDDVIKKIQTYVKKIGYRPNIIAQSLRTGKSKIIVFMVEDIGNDFFAKLARIIEDLAYQQDYKVLFCSNENNDERSRELINLFYERQVDGFILIPSPGIQEDITYLMKNNVPVVLFDRYFPKLKTNHVIIDNLDASKKATEHLIANGFKNIGFITLDTQQTQMKDRLKGYEQAIKEAKLKSNVLQIPYNETIRSKAGDMINYFFELNKQLDAVFFSTNYLTQTGLEVIKNSNEDLIHQLGIITFDDKDLFKIYSPSISAVEQPLQEIGENLMEIMMQKIHEEQPSNEIIQRTLPAKLIARESSQKK